MTQTYKPHISAAKKQEVEDIKALFREYPVAGIINLEGIPTLMLQRIRYALGKDLIIKPSKKRFMKFAFDELKSSHKNIEQLKEKLQGIPALMFTKDDPFLIYKKIDKNKAVSVAKPGQKAPRDLLIEAGETPFTPGPMIGELGMLGLKTEVKNGKIYVKESKILVKSGEVITDKVAALLAKLGIEPMKVGLNVLLTYQNGEILDKSVLAIDEEEYTNNIKLVHATSFALAVHLGIANTVTAKTLLMKSERESEAVAGKANIMTSGNIEETLAKTESAALLLDSKIQETPQKEPYPQEKIKQEDIKEAGISMEQTVALAHKLIGSGIKDSPKEQFETPKKEELDINKLINALKDKKTGEIS